MEISGGKWGCYTTQVSVLQQQLVYKGSLTLPSFGRLIIYTYSAKPTIQIAFLQLHNYLDLSSTQSASKKSQML